MAVLLSLLSFAIRDGPYPVYWDGLNPTYVPRDVVSGVPAEYSYSFPPGVVEANATHARIPMQRALQVGYSRAFHTSNDYESGVKNINVLPNPISLMSPLTVVYFTEKSHATSVTGSSHTQTADANRKTARAQEPAVKSLARLSAVRRDRYVGTYMTLSGIGSQLIEAGRDMGHLNKIRDYVKSENGRALVDEKLASEQSASLLAKAKAALDSLPASVSQKSEQDCFHFEPVPDMRVTGTHWEVPLRKNIVGMRGLGSFSPLARFGEMYGSAIFDFDPTGSLTIYYQASSYFQLDDPTVNQTGLTPPTFWVGPANGKDMAVDTIDGRTGTPFTTPTPRPHLNNLYSALQEWPIDYERMWLPEDEICPESLKEQLAESFYNFSEVNEEHTKEAKDLDEGSSRARLWDKLQDAGVQTVANAVRCGTNYLRADLAGTHGYDMVEYLVWVHFVIETPSELGFPAISSRTWDDGVTTCPVGCKFSPAESPTRHLMFASSPSVFSRCPANCVAV